MLSPRTGLELHEGQGLCCPRSWPWCPFLMDFQIVQWKCPLHNKIGHALSKKNFTAYNKICVRVMIFVDIFINTYLYGLNEHVFSSIIVDNVANHSQLQTKNQNITRHENVLFLRCFPFNTTTGLGFFCTRSSPKTHCVAHNIGQPRYYN